ncbi:MAG: GC-type dockerin domain-anchored protein [Phycisphaerales bacterium]
MTRSTTISSLGLLIASCGLAAAEVPTYRVEVISTYETTTFLGDASEAGHLAGSQTLTGFLTPFVARQGDGVTHLPLPPGYLTGMAFDVNNSGVVVGTVSESTLPFDLGEPAIWTPDGAGGYTVTIPEQFDTLASPLGNLSVSGGQAVAINDAGVIVGWSRYQGFQGGPTTRFFESGCPINLSELGFTATVHDISENGLIAGGELVMDLATGQVTTLGVPSAAGGVAFTFVESYAVNNDAEVVVAAHRATSTNDKWLTYVNRPQSGYGPLNPAQLPTRFVGFYDNNNRGDIAATGGVLFADEDVLVPGFDGLLEPGSAEWDTDLGFIKDDRRVYTTAFNTTTDENALVVLVPEHVCIADLTGDGALNVDDIDEFVVRFLAGDLAADMDSNGILNVDDIDAFVAVFLAGCA